MEFIIVILCVIIGVLVRKIIKDKNKVEQIAKNIIDKKFEEYNKNLENQYQVKENKLKQTYIQKEKELEKDYDFRKEQLNAKFNSEIKENEHKKEILKIQLNSEEEKLAQLKENHEAVMKEYEEKLKIQMVNRLDATEELEFARSAAAIEVYMAECKKKRDEIKKEIAEIEEELSNFRSKRNAINEEIVRQRELEENEDFYKVVLDDASLHDLALLSEIKSQFSKIDLLQKLMYDNYISKPVKEMTKRVLSGNDPCGIYKITRLKTGEVYVGQSVKVASRWNQHAKSCYHCGTISHSTLHTTMEKDGIQNFTWELLEEVPKEKLNEREKYWIEFYDSKKYGMNEKVGG